MHMTQPTGQNAVLHDSLEKPTPGVVSVTNKFDEMMPTVI